MRYFQVLGLQDKGYRSIDLAREFGTAQAILSPDDDRVIVPRPPAQQRCERRGLFENGSDGKAHNLPTRF